MHIGFSHARPIIVIGWMRGFSAPVWAIRILQAGLALMAAGVAVILGILAYAAVSIATGAA